MFLRITVLTLLFVGLFITEAPTYPLDGYNQTNIARLDYLQLVVDGKIKGTKPIPGAMKLTYEIQLTLTDEKGDSVATIPAPDPVLQEAINKLFPRLNENYSVAILDITPGRPIRYASRKETVGYQPGSVGKLAVLFGFFTELAKIYPESFAERQDLLCTKEVR